MQKYSRVCFLWLVLSQLTQSGPTDTPTHLLEEGSLSIETHFSKVTFQGQVGS